MIDFFGSPFLSSLSARLLGDQITQRLGLSAKAGQRPKIVARGNGGYGIHLKNGAQLVGDVDVDASYNDKGGIKAE